MGMESTLVCIWRNVFFNSVTTLFIDYFSSRCFFSPNSTPKTHLNFQFLWINRNSSLSAFTSHTSNPRASFITSQIRKKMNYSGLYSLFTLRKAHSPLSLNRESAQVFLSQQTIEMTIMQYIIILENLNPIYNILSS